MTQEKRPLKVFIAPFGSAGDINPFVPIAQELLRRGHDVTFAANEHFEPTVGGAGVPFVSTGSRAEHRAMLDDPDLWRSGLGLHTMMKVAATPTMRRVYALLAERNEPGRTVAVGSTYGLGTRIADDKLGVPSVTLHLSPASMLSVYDSPHVDRKWLRHIPAGAWRPVRWWNERRKLDPPVAPPINELRGELGLPPVKRVHSTWMHSPRRVIGLWPEWFAARQRDWPASARTSGFVLYDGSNGADLTPELKAFLAAGPSPIVFVTSTAMTSVGSFLTESIAACERLGRRGVLVTSIKQGLPEKLPEFMCRVDYAPLGRLLPQCRAIVHLGAIGTAAQGLAAGLPHLAVPRGTDQPQNAARVRRLGVGWFLLPEDYRAPIVAKTLEILLGSKKVAQRCAEVAKLMRGSSPVPTVCDEIEQVVTGAAAGAKVPGAS